MISATTTTLREKRYIDCRSGSSSVTISMNWALPTPGPTMRIGWLPVSSIIWNEPVIASHAVMSRRSMSCSIVAGKLSLASSRRCWPILIATARALMLLRISRDSESGTMPSGAASSTSAAVFAAATRSLSRLTQKLAMAGT